MSIENQPVLSPDDDYNKRKYVLDSIKSGYTQWLYKGNTVVPIGNSTPTLPAGIYNVKWDSDMQMPVPLSKSVDIDELLILPTPILDRVLVDIRSFWKNKEKYQKYGSVYKRGILLYGLPGCGKSSVIMLLAKELITKYNGVVFTPQNEEQVDFTMKIIPIVKDIEPDKRIIVGLAVNASSSSWGLS